MKNWKILTKNYETLKLRILNRPLKCPCLTNIERKHLSTSNKVPKSLLVLKHKLLVPLEVTLIGRAYFTPNLTQIKRGAIAGSRRFVGKAI